MSRCYVEMGFRDTNSEIVSNTPQQSKQINPRGLPLVGWGTVYSGKNLTLLYDEIALFISEQQLKMESHFSSPKKLVNIIGHHNSEDISSNRIP